MKDPATIYGSIRTFTEPAAARPSPGGMEDWRDGGMQEKMPLSPSAISHSPSAISHQPSAILLLSAFLATTAAASQSRIVWSNAQPCVEITATTEVVTTLTEISGTLNLFGPEGNPLWATQVKIPMKEGKPVPVTVKLEKAAVSNVVLRTEVQILQPALRINYAETLRFGQENRPIQSYSFSKEGDYPDQHAWAAVVLNPIKDAEIRSLDLDLSLRDADGNAVTSKIQPMPVSPLLALYRVDVTPARESIGPYTLDYKIENDALSIFFNASERFAFANCRIPLTSFEVEGRLWSATERDEPMAVPGVSYDHETVHSGKQSLRITYPQGTNFGIWAHRVLPGLPTHATLWVKGCQTNDRLYILWSDHYDPARSAWNRFINTSREFVCTLDFDGWRSFRVPVLGAGLQVRSPAGAGSTKEIDVPVYVNGFSIESSNPPKDQPRKDLSIYIDDIAAETQARVNDQLTIELRGDTKDCLLSPNARAFLSLGNGTGKAVDECRIRLTAKDRLGNTVQEANDTVAIPADGFALKEISLADAFGKAPLGPVDVDVTCVIPAMPGARAQDRLTFKNAKSYGTFWDFERPAKYSGWKGGYGAATAAGGADGSTGALKLAVIPRSKSLPEPDTPYRAPHGPSTTNSVILHPSLPGIPDRIEVMVKCSGKPITLQPVLVDNGLTGEIYKDYNAFWLPPVSVDGQDWRKIELVAPAIPPNYAAKSIYFMNKPYYPLNLILIAYGESEEPTEILFDNIRVRTHLYPHEELISGLVFPDDTQIHKPGSPLEIFIMNFAAAEKKLAMNYRLDSFQERTVAQGVLNVSVPAGQRTVQALVPALTPGMYELSVTTPEPPARPDAARKAEGQAKDPEPPTDQVAVQETVQTLDASACFGADPAASLLNVPGLRKTLDLTIERICLDWDSLEGIPGMFHFNWFNNDCKRVSLNGAYQIQPVLGFSADWAGPYAQEVIAKGGYSRFIGNYLQVPVRLSDWSLYVQTCLREYRGRFPEWVFWENPDIEGSSQSIPPERYPEMLKIVKQWVSAYDPKARIVAGGFNVDRALDYLESIKNPAQLPFDEIAVQMNIGELAPERADVEGFLDEMNALLDIEKTRRNIQIVDLDWQIGKFVTPAQQAAYHTRSLLILNSRGAAPHRFSFANNGQTFDGPGVFYRPPYGNSICLQTLKPAYAPKPSYFAIMQTRKFLASYKFVRSVLLPEFNLQANRAFIYRDDAANLAAAVWRTTGDSRLYRAPESWKGAKVTDAFGFDAPLTNGLRCAPLPVFVSLPAPYTVEQMAFDLRTLAPADGRDRVLLDLFLGEPDTCQRARYAATGTTTNEEHYGRIPGGRKLKETFVKGLATEQFEFQLDKPGDVLMSRRWLFSDNGQSLTLKLNGGADMPWDLGKGQGNAPGIRESTFVLRNAIAGTNVVSVRYAAPGNCAGYRVEPLATNWVDLAQWGVLNAMQTKGELQKCRSAGGTPLQIGKVPYATGLGSHANAFMEYPLDGQFKAFEVTVAVDAVTDGRGTVICSINVDGQEKATSGLINGFSKPVTLRVDSLETARRMLLIIKDAGDGNADDMADWVEGKLYLK